LYSIFGDNFIIALASLAKEAKRDRDSVEFDDKSLEDALLTASQLSKDKENNQQEKNPSLTSLKAETTRTPSMRY
jgi:CRISPR-associated protein CsaX